MRRNNLELRKTFGDNNKRFEIIKWQENPYYQKESEYIKEDDFYYKEEICSFSIHKSCFEDPESCYVVSFIENGIVDFVGDRVIELESIQEFKDYFFLLRSGISKSTRYKIKK